MKRNNNISAYILCGGLSSRMQQEKGLVLFKDKPFLRHIIEAVKPITNTIYLVTKNMDYERFGYPLVSDVYENRGPVGGIYTALEHSETKLNLILSCDIPNITTSVLKTYLTDKILKEDVLYLKDEKQEYPLIGVYSKAVVPKFGDAIQANRLRLFELIKHLKHKVIKVKYEDHYALQNINTKEELMSLIAVEK